MAAAAVTLPLAAALVPAAATPAAAAPCTPAISGPSDPEYAPAERDPSGGQTFNEESWHLYDCLPQSAPLATDDEGAAGMSVNAYWRDRGYGRDEVVVAYVEGGVNWRRADTAPELRRRAFLNTAELPLPQDGTGASDAGAGAGGYDLDGDGIVTVDDYADDPRVARPLLHATTAGGITAEDLIVAFSDGTDDDGNGYPDDISGWNFHRDTNDPQTDQSVYNHANVESENILGERDNDIRSAGICPSCRLLSVKAGDESIDRADKLAQAIVFAVDAGADVVAAVAIGLGDSATLAGAVQYAYRHGVVVSLASNDFESTDHTEGMRYAHVWPGNTVVSDQTNRLGRSSPNDATARTFRSRSSVTSYGAHALFAAPAVDGSTSAGVPSQAGVAALVYSAGLDAVDAGVLDVPLDADEVKQVVRSTVSDVVTTPPSVTGSPFPAQPGFDIHYGYGRPNVARAGAAVLAGDVPPTVDVQSPRWYDAVDPTVRSTYTVEAEVAARRSSSYTYEVQYGLGPQPAEDEFVTVATGSGTGPQRVVADLELSQIPESFWGGGYEITADRLSAERYTVTVRVQVTDADGRLGEDRRGMYVRHDDTLLEAFPVRVRERADADLPGGTDSAPTLADVEGRGELDVVTNDGGTIHVLRPDGTPAPGWPVSTGPAPGHDPGGDDRYLDTPAWSSGQVPQPEDPVSTTPSVGDLDHDGGLDVVAATTNGRVWAWDGAGRVKPGFPVSIGDEFRSQSVPVPDTPFVRNRSRGAFGSPGAGGPGRRRDAGGGARRLGRPGPRLGRRRRGAAGLAGGDAEPGHLGAAGLRLRARLQGGDDAGGGRRGLRRDARPGGRAGRHLLPGGQPLRAGDRVPDGVPRLGEPAPGRSARGRLPGGDPRRRPGLRDGAGLRHRGRADARHLRAGRAADGRRQRRAVLPAACRPGLGRGAARHAGAVRPGRTAADGERRCCTSPPRRRSATSPGPAPCRWRRAALPRRTSRPESWRRRGSVSASATGCRPSTPRAAPRLPGLAAPAADPGATGRSPSRALADVSGDGVADVLVQTDSAALHAVDAVTGQEVPGFPKWTGDFGLWTPAVGDLDGDGLVEVVASTRSGMLFAWRTPGLAEANDEAWHYGQNDRTTGRYGDDTRPPAAATDVSYADGVLSFTAPGDDWTVGTASRYEVVRAAQPISQDTFAAASPVDVSAVVPGEAGTAEALSVGDDPARPFYAVRAVDDVGNLGPVRVLASGSGGATGSGDPEPVVPESPVAVLLPLLALAGLAGGSRGPPPAARHPLTQLDPSSLQELTSMEIVRRQLLRGEGAGARWAARARRRRAVSHRKAARATGSTTRAAQAGRQRKVSVYVRSLVPSSRSRCRMEAAHVSKSGWASTRTTAASVGACQVT